MKTEKSHFRPIAVFLALSLGIMLSGPLAGQLARYEFTDNSLAVTDLNGDDGVTFSALSINGYTMNQAFSDAGDTIADPTLDYISLSGAESPVDTSSALAANQYLSFTITNNSGGELSLNKFTGDFQKTNVFTQFAARLFNTASPASVVNDTIAKLGAASGGTGLEQDEAILDGTSSEAGSTWSGVPFTIADAASATFYFPFIMNSSATTRYMGIDNIEITGSFATGPGFAVAPGTADPDFNFAFFNDDPASSNLPTSRTVTYANSGGADVTITNVAVSGTDAASFSVSTNPATGGGLTLTPTDTVEVTLNFDSAPAGSKLYQAQVEITTDFAGLDRAEPASVDYGLIGESVVSNGNFEGAVHDEGWSGNSEAFGGLAPGSSTAVRTLPGEAFFYTLDQPIYDDWDVSFFFAVEEFAGATGSNRNFNLRITKGDNVTSYVNLSYQPAGASGPGFYIFDGSTWQPVVYDNGTPNTGNLVTLANSLDANADGDFDDPGDVKNTYFMRIVGNQYNSGVDNSHFYNLYLYDSTGTLVGFEEDLQFNQFGNPADVDQPLRGIAFASDFGSNPGFIVDDVNVLRSVDSGTGFPLRVDPDLQVAAAPEHGSPNVIANPTGSYAGSLVVRNAPDATGPLTLSAVSFSDATHFSLNGALPGAIAPGATATLQVDFTPGSDRGAFPCTITINSDDSLTDPTEVDVFVVALDDGDKVLANWDFKASPFDTHWTNDGNVTSFGGLNTVNGNSTQSAEIATEGNLSQATPTGLSDFSVEFYFAMSNVDGRAMNFRLFGNAGASGTSMNTFRYMGDLDEFQVFDGSAWQTLFSEALNSSLDFDGDGSFGNDPGDIRNVYRVRVDGRGYGTAGAEYDVLLFEEDGRGQHHPAHPASPTEW